MTQNNQYIEAVNAHFDGLCNIMLSYMESIEQGYSERWIPITVIKDELGLKRECYPKHSKTQGAKGWFFASLARALEDDGRIEYRIEDRRSYCRRYIA
ncbi:hypothetical protein ACGRH2_01665 [Vibrio barjaei]|jgi:hypothetical protein|uniref:Uncharacterized protein n=1 Tax=Vibrio barjaei TaxID=1676683 RepID=A0ABW7ICF3_9VIBR